MLVAARGNQGIVTLELALIDMVYFVLSGRHISYPPLFTSEAFDSDWHHWP